MTDEGVIIALGEDARETAIVEIACLEASCLLGIGQAAKRERPLTGEMANEVMIGIKQGDGFVRKGRYYEFN